MGVVCMLRPVSAVPYLMDESRKRALWRCHQDLRRDITVNNFLPGLHIYAGGFLTDVEYDSIRKQKGNVDQVDELMDIL